MLLRDKLRRLEKVEHSLHVSSLILLVLSAIAELISSYLLAQTHADTYLLKLLHIVHWVCVALAVGSILLQFRYRTKPSETIAKFLQDPNTAVQPWDPKLPYVYPGEGVDQKHFTFVGTSDARMIQILCKMNLDAYEGSPFEMSPHEVDGRNREMIARSSSAFMLFRDPNREVNTPYEFAGYTSVLPLNAAGKDLYLRGLVSDRELPATLLCAEGESAAMILFFAMHLETAYKEKGAGKLYSRFLVRCIEHHIGIVASRYAGDAEDIEVWVQSESTEMGKRYSERGYVKSNSRSKEGFPLYCRRTRIPR